jgi:hypothetical protein
MISLPQYWKALEFSFISAIPGERKDTVAVSRTSIFGWTYCGLYNAEGWSFFTLRQISSRNAAFTLMLINSIFSLNTATI